MVENQAEQRQKLRKSMMGLLARREHSKLELLQKLQIRGFDTEQIHTNIDDFIDNNWQSDRRYAEMLVRDRVLKNRGPLKITIELKQKGISADIIDDCMNQEIDWLSIARRAIEKKFTSPAVAQNEKLKQYRFLQQRGFSNEQIKSALNHRSAF